LNDHRNADVRNQARQPVTVSDTAWREPMKAKFYEGNLSRPSVPPRIIDKVNKCQLNENAAVKTVLAQALADSAAPAFARRT
jgi:hypothetical protein